MCGFHPGQLPFLLWAASDTLPTAVYLKHWCVQSNARCKSCHSSCPTTAHIIGGCPVASFIVTEIYVSSGSGALSSGLEIFSDYPSIHVFTDLQGFRAGEAPQSTIPSTPLITPHRPDIVIYNSDKPFVALLELTCPL